MTNDDRRIELKVARSSLGTKSAVAARSSVSTTRAAQVVARSKTLRQAAQVGGKTRGGKR